MTEQERELDLQLAEALSEIRRLEAIIRMLKKELAEVKELLE